MNIIVVFINMKLICNHMMCIDMTCIDVSMKYFAIRKNGINVRYFRSCILTIDGSLMTERFTENDVAVKLTSRMLHV